MFNPDLINSLFEGLAGVMLWNNVRVLAKHKEIRGISVLTVILFSLWGYWNLFYYPHLDQWLSFVAGILVVTANSAWIVLALKYRRN